MFFSSRDLPIIALTYYFSPMGIRKLLSFVLFACFACACVFSMSIDDMVAKAMENSTTIRTLEINRENTLITRQINDADDKISVTVKSGDVTVRREDTHEMQPKAQFSFGPSVDVEIPVSDDSTLSFGVSSSTSIYNNGNTNVTVTPNAGYRYVTTFNSYTDTREDISKRTNELKLEQSYQKSKLQFQNSFLQNVASIMQSELSIKTQQITYDRLVADYESSLASGDITDGNVKDMQSKMNIDSKKVALDSAKEKLKKSLELFKENYGFDYETPDTVRAPNLEFNQSVHGNTNVLLAEMALETAKQAVDAAEGTSNKFQLGANASVPINYRNNNNDPTITANASVSGTVTGANYSLEATAGGKFYESDREIFPYVTISGMWKNKTTTETDALNIQSLKNKVILAQIDYDNALLTYRTDSEKLRESIEDYISSLRQLEVNLTYDAVISGITAQMHEAGLATDRELEDAELKVESDKIQMMIQNINGLVIENNIAINEL